MPNQLTPQNLYLSDVFTYVDAHVKQHAPEVAIIKQPAMEPSKTPLDILSTVRCMGPFTSSHSNRY